MKIIGTCSECHGPVAVPYVWYGTVPPPPRCAACGAKPRNPYGAVIPMLPDPIDEWDSGEALKKTKALLERLQARYPAVGETSNNPQP